jgi:hypothetical protein
MPMAGIKITRFLGTAPKRAQELLPDTAAQVARNCKLYSGDLLPYPNPVAVGATGDDGITKTLYALRNPDGSLRWLHWTTDVDIAVATPNEDNNQRFYYTGDGVPKTSDYALYPDYFELGLPIPPNATRLVTSVFGDIGERVVTHYSRDSGNTTRLVTSAPHNFRTGSMVTVTGFTQLVTHYTRTNNLITVKTYERLVDFDLIGDIGFPQFLTPHGLSVGASVILNFISGKAVSGVYTVEEVVSPTEFKVLSGSSGSTSGAGQLSLKPFNATNVEVTVINDTTFEYFNPGPAVSELEIDTVRVNLSGLTQARSYVFTWITPWGEESIASKPSEELFIKEGQFVHITAIPAHPPEGKNYIRGVNLYRTVPSLSGTEYFKLSSLWFPVEIASVSRNLDVSRVTTKQWHPHNLDIDDVFLINASSVGSFNIEGGVVTDVIDEYTFEYYQEGPAVPTTAVASGVIYRDISEDPGVTMPRYWGLGSYDFLDDFDSRLLLDGLKTDEYEAPPKNLQGLLQIGNNILAGFVDNEVFFSEPNEPHAWPRSYSVVLEHNIVGMAATSGSLLVLTESYPYIMSVNDPAAGISQQRIDVQYPCLNRNSIATMSYGIVYATHGGLALYSPFAGPQILTRENHYSETWNEDLDPTTLVASFYNEVYIAAHSSGGIVFDRDEQTGGQFVDLDTTFTSIWYDALHNRLYFTAGVDNTIYEWNSPAQAPMTQIWKSKVVKTPDMINIGAARVIADYAGSPNIWNNTAVKWSEFNEPWSSAGGVTFRMWADKKIIATVTLSDDGTFRLPTGYRTDTFEIGVEGKVRVRAIHLAETPLGLKEI